jgi:hypothetical protein
MDMDLYGVSPVTEDGTYFRANVWSWRPLWDLIVRYCPDVLSEDDVVGGHYNDGYEIDAGQATEIAHRLELGLADGGITKYVVEYARQQSELPLVRCDYCDGTGIRTDNVGATQGMIDRELPESTAIVVGRQRGWCNACEGYGESESFLTWYHLDVNIVDEFATFCKNSGGFTIC